MLNFTRSSHIALSAAALSVISTIGLPAIAQEPDQVCYMITESGRVLDLSQSLCHSENASAASASADDLFLADYKRAVMNYPDVRDTLLRKSPESNISYAQAVCNGLKAGLAPNIIQNMQAQQIVKASGGVISERVAQVDIGIINGLAPQYYCPQFN